MLALYIYKKRIYVKNMSKRSSWNKIDKDEPFATHWKWIRFDVVIVAHSADDTDTNPDVIAS